MRIAVYTCITGSYDTLSKICPNQNPDIDFICFTDNPQLEYSSGNWSIRPIPEELLNLPPVKQQRIIKICSHRYLPEYDITLWVDGNITILSDIMKFIGGYDLEKTPFWTKQHPGRKCIYDEAKAVIRVKKDSPENINRQIESYRAENFPEKYGLHETGIILRRNNDFRTKVFENMWASQILKYSHRDQLSFDYCRWRCKYEVGRLNVGNLLKDVNFRWRRHGK